MKCLCKVSQIHWLFKCVTNEICVNLNIASIAFSYCCYLYFNITNYLLHQVHADDPDRGENGKVTYELTQPTGKFGINSDSGNVTVIVPIDHEKETSKFIQVCCQHFNLRKSHL